MQNETSSLKELREHKADLEQNIRRLETKYKKLNSEDRRSDGVKGRIRTQVTNNPVQSVAVFAVAGFVIGKLLKKRSSSYQSSDRRSSDRKGIRQDHVQSAGRDASESNNQSGSLLGFVAEEIKRQIAQRGVRFVVNWLQSAKKT